MKLKQWRENKGISQQDLAQKMQDFRNEKYPEEKRYKKLSQRALGYWETGTVPRKFWLKVIAAFTGNKVTGADFAG
jgi:transcriptional regulator with XRE-family HTH domain